MIVTQQNCSTCNQSHPLGDHFYPKGEWDTPEIAETDEERCWAQRTIPYLIGSRIVLTEEENRCQFRQNHYSPHQCPPRELSNGQKWRGEWFYREDSGLNDGNYTMERPNRGK